MLHINKKRGGAVDKSQPRERKTFRPGTLSLLRFGKTGLIALAFAALSLSSAANPTAWGSLAPTGSFDGESGRPVMSGGPAAVAAMGGHVPSTLVPVGRTAGIKLFTDGVMVVGMSEVETDKGVESPAMRSGLHVGDVICAVNGEAVEDTKSLSSLTARYGATELTLSVKRDGERKNVLLTPVLDKSDNRFKIGAWVRDSMAGIGTITFYDPASGVFGALGHGICDMDTGKLMPLSRGSVMPSSVTSICKGKSGTPGELRGTFDLENDFGSLFSNSETGIYGYVGDKNYFDGLTPLPVATRSQVERGKAYILSNIEGDLVKQYEIEITKLPTSPEQIVKNMMIRVTDKELLEKTGGIVQGMSGSPIIQNGRLVGAVTHVLVNDPTRGYAIFIENMLDATTSEEELLAG